ncbi:MAG: anhydro-N-acetylmuramic acid kinase [Elusimicrobia bacterium GWC2_65_9]|nr:MAG: anhydro-N-acetylmuramic acid kinase [Elusimicrobia bacterium GWA2_66_18]OGR69026.1 MAG: anhydro-N-acetylmuramic acid kinase [Elusimicrobia bacterium GWC2_65_9]
MSKKRLAVGLMSGTSADGVTAALVEISPDRVRVRRFETYPYSARLKNLVLEAPSLRAPEISLLNFALGEAFAFAALQISRGARPLVIGSHGQTVWHGPNAVPPNTLQLAEPAVIAERTGLTTVADFRPRDMAAGGQGAPLTPAFDLFLYGRGPLRAVVNIGGIANVSLVGHGRLWSAFDTGPGNGLMDEAVRRVTKNRSEMDRGGKLAARGKPDEKLLKRLLHHPYFRTSPPKSLDRATFGAALLDRYFPRLTRARLPGALATLAELTARSLRLSVLENAPDAPLAEVVVSGGGALNAHLMRRLRVLFAPVPVTTTAAHGLPVMAKEAACFAWLAARVLDGKPNHAPAATGARGVRILGKIVLA